MPSEVAPNFMAALRKLVILPGSTTSALSAPGKSAAFLESHSDWQPQGSGRSRTDHSVYIETYCTVRDVDMAVSAERLTENCTDVEGSLVHSRLIPATGAVFPTALDSRQIEIR